MNKWKTYNNIFSSYTINSLIKLAQRHAFGNLIGRISMGKEAVILIATHELFGLVAVKVYMINTCNFRRMYEYLSQDNRYISIPKTRINIVKTWTEREFKNLDIAYKAKVNVPMPIEYLNNVIVMDFVGDKDRGLPAPKLKDIDKPEQFFEEVIENYKKLVKAGLVHGDLSEYNILVMDKPFFIDFSQGTIIKSPSYPDLLKRDIEKIHSYFSRFIDISFEEIAKKIGAWDIVKNL